MFLSPHVQYDGLVILVSRYGDHAGLAVVPVHGYGGVAPMLKSNIRNQSEQLLKKKTFYSYLESAAEPLLTSSTMAEPKPPLTEFPA